MYDRIAENRLKTLLLLVFAIAALVPFVAGLSWGFSEVFVHQFGQRRMSLSQENRIRKALGEQERTESVVVIESRLREQHLARERAEAEDAVLQPRIMAVGAAALVALFGLLVWAIGSSPTTKLLTLCGARPAGPGEQEAQDLLAKLAHAARLPRPRLCVIDSPAINAFAAGADPSRSVIAVTRGLLTLLETVELEAVLAHELSHIGNRDTVLNTIVSVLALFLRLPHLLRRRRHFERHHTVSGQSKPMRSRFWIFYSAAMLPVYIYVFFIAPVLAAVIRAAVSRNREFIADADAALLTRNPEGLVRALAKIRGAGSAVAGSNPAFSHIYFANPALAGTAPTFFSGKLLATHPPIERRIQRLLELGRGVAAGVIESAVRAGETFARDRAPHIETATAPAQDELSCLTMGNPMGRVCRAIAGTPVYDQPSAISVVVSQVQAGELLVVFDDPGKFRQVLTAHQTFGYIPCTVKLKRVDMLPSEVYEQANRAVAPSTPAVSSAEKVTETVAADAADPVVLPRRAPRPGLSPSQIAAVAIFAVVVFAAVILVMEQFAGK